MANTFEDATKIVTDSIRDMESEMRKRLTPTVLKRGSVIRGKGLDTRKIFFAVLRPMSNQQLPYTLTREEAYEVWNGDVALLGGAEELMSPYFEAVNFYAQDCPPGGTYRHLGFIYRHTPNGGKVLVTMEVGLDV